MKIKVASMNIGRIKQDYQHNIKTLTKLLSDSQPDIILFQEYIPDEHLCELIYQACGLHCSYFKEFSQSHVTEGERMGIAAFSYGEVEENAEHKLIKPEKCFYHNGCPEYLHDKYFVSLITNIKAQKVQILTGHSYSFHRYQIDPADFLEIYTDLDVWLCAQIQDEKTVILGDFNLESIEPFLPKLNYRFKDVFAGMSTRPSGRKTDYILIPKESKYSDNFSIKCEARNPYTGFDHNYLVANIDI